MEGETQKDFTTPCREAKSGIIKKLTTILRRERFSYQELQYVFREVRRRLAVKPERKPYKLPVLLSEEELRRLYRVIGAEKDLRRELMLKLLFYTGVRNHELTNIRMEDVYLEESRIFIRQGKGSKDRYVLFAEPFRLALKAHMQTCPRNVYLFETQRCTKYSTRRIQQIVKEYAAKAGITKRVYPHLLRHQVFTFLINHGLTRDELKLISGHSSERNLEIYSQLSIATVQKKYDEAMRGLDI